MHWWTNPDPDALNRPRSLRTGSRWVQLASRGDDQASEPQRDHEQSGPDTVEVRLTASSVSSHGTTSSRITPRRWPCRLGAPQPTASRGGRASVAVAAAVGLQFTIPLRLVFRPHRFLPVVALLLVVAPLVATPRRINSQSTSLRRLSLVMIAVLSVANAWSAVSSYAPRCRDRGPRGWATAEQWRCDLAHQRDRLLALGVRPGWSGMTSQRPSRAPGTSCFRR